MHDPDAPAPERRLRVLQIGTEWFTARTFGGVERVYSGLFASLPGAGIDALGVVAAPDDVAVLTDNRVRSFAPAGASLPARLRGVRRTVARLLREEPVAVVACHFALYGLPVLDRLGDRPLAMHFHGPWADESARDGQRRAAVAAKRLVERAVYRRAQRVIVLSRAFAALAVRDYGIAEDRVRVVGGSVDLPRFAVAQTRAQARDALGWPDDRPILFTARRLFGRMGLHQLVEAMALVRRDVPEVLLHVAGRGPLLPALQQQVQALGLEGNVRFLGFVPEADLPLAYRAADINVMPSEALEGFGLSAAEGLAAGTPSMVTPVGGLPEVVSGLSPALVFRSGGAHDLADGLASALQGRIPLPDSEACRAHAAACFSPSACAERIAAAYREIA